MARQSEAIGRGPQQREEKVTRWSVSRALVRLREVVREEGYRSLWFKILGETVYRRVLLVERPLDEPFPTIEPRTPIVVELLDPGGIEAYLAFRTDTSHHELERRLAAGDVCFMARQADRIIGVTWAATERGWTRYLGREIALRPDEVYTYDWLTAPRFRRQHVASRLTLECLRYFRARGYRRVIYAMAPEKYDKRRGQITIGARPCGKIGYVRIGPWRWQWTRYGDRAA
jgi:GNAT superfamily N-acetyltransferase